jgi:hypothetical protein
MTIRLANNKAGSRALPCIFNKKFPKSNRLRELVVKSLAG